MRPLPAQTVHRPFEAGPYRMAMDLVAIREPDWFEIDNRYTEETANRRGLLKTRRADVFATQPVSDAARLEALNLILAALTTHHPDWFSRQGDIISNHLTGETWQIGATDPLEIAGRLLQEDLCLIQNSNEGPIFTAAILCFPSRWKLLEKLGKPLSAVHGPVPFYADRLARPVDRFMRHLKPGHIVARLNWSLLDDPTLHQPTGKWRLNGAPNVTPTNAGSQIFLRVERQTLRRLPTTEAILFTIRVHVYPLETVIDHPNRATTLTEAVRNLPPEVQHYKSLLPFRAALLTWLDATGSSA